MVFRRAVVVLAMAIGLTSYEVSVAETNPYVSSLPLWEGMLTEFVDDQGRIDFHRLARDPTNLKSFVAVIAEVSPESHPELFPTRSDVIAYHLNAYNAHAMLGILDRDIPDGFTSFFKRASFFRFRSIVVGGNKTNLYTYENKVIRPLGEPRVHFALNCMVRDCPRLPRVAFAAGVLESQLQDASYDFFNDSKYVRIDSEEKRVFVSSILDFYTIDFVASGDREDLVPYINQYRRNPIPLDYEVEFIDYDWRTNHAPRFGG